MKSTWKYVFGSVVGSSHLAVGTPCQDNCLVHVHRVAAGDIIIIAAADGAGSASRSDLGSKLACTEVVSCLIEHLSLEGGLSGVSIDTAQEWVDRICQLLRKKAFEDGAALRDYACTLLTAVITAESGLFMQVGDGAIVIGRDGLYAPAFWPTQGEYANTTVFVTDERAHEALQFDHRTECVDEVAVLTDGLQSLALKFDTKEAHSGFFRPLFERLAAEEPGESCDLRTQMIDWLGSPKILARTDDDKTLALATRRPASQRNRS